jgi:hypothetical protein
LKVHKIPGSGCEYVSLIKFNTGYDLGTGVMRLHALQSINVETTPLHVNLSRLGHEAAFDRTSRPESVTHLAPWLLWIGAVEGCSVLAGHEARRELGDLDFDYGLLAGGRLYRVRRPILGQLDREVVGVEIVFIGIEAVVFELVGGEEVGRRLVGIEDL